MKVNDWFDKVVVINLDRRTDRMERLDKQLTELGIEYERFSAIDGKALGIDPITAGTMSHCKVLEQSIEKKVLILEDDALFCEDFNEKFEQVIEKLPPTADIYYFGALLSKEFGKVLDIGNSYWFRQHFTTGSQAYSVHPARVQMVVDHLKDYTFYIDIGLREWGANYNAFIAQPNLVTQFPSFSDLRGKEVNDF